jgi:hypothetical protein
MARRDSREAMTMREGAEIEEFKAESHWLRRKIRQQIRRKIDKAHQQSDCKNGCQF